MNRITLIGRLGKDPETKTVNNTTVVTVSLATTEKFKDKDGNSKENTDWHTCVFWGKAAEVIGKYATKGTQLAIEGKQKTRSYDDKNGQKHFVTENLVTSFEFLGGAKRPETAPSTASLTPEMSYTEQPGDDLPF